MDKRSIDIIIPTFDRRHFLEIILNVIKSKAGFSHRIIIVKQPSNDDTDLFLYDNKSLYNILIEVSKKMFLSDALNLGLQKVNSEDFVVMNDDTLVGTNGWLKELYSAYKEGYTEKDKHKEWFAMLPYIIPNKKEAIDPLSLNNNIVRAGGHWSSWCRIQNTKKVRDAGGFKVWERGGRDFEGGSFGNLSASYKQAIGRHYGIKAIDLSVMYKYKNIFNIIVDRFLTKGEVPYEIMESS